MSGPARALTGPVLAFDTSTPEGSVALAQGDAILARGRLGERSEHAARLVPAIEDVLDRAAVDREGLAAIVVGEGPGSFTGVRVAAATAKGLARGLSVPLWAVSSLGAAAMALGEGTVRYVLFDARSDRVYGACYALDGDVVTTVVDPFAGTIGEILGEPVPTGAVFVGDGAVRHRAQLEGAGHEVVAPAGEGGVSLAEGVLRVFRRDPFLEPVADPGGWEPAYLRGFVATPA